MAIFIYTKMISTKKTGGVENRARKLIEYLLPINNDVVNLYTYKFGDFDFIDADKYVKYVNVNPFYQFKRYGLLKKFRLVTLSRFIDNIIFSTIIKRKYNIDNSIIVVYGLHNLLSLPKTILKNNRVILSQTSHPAANLNVAHVNEFKACFPYVDDIVTYTLSDEDEVRKICREYAISCNHIKFHNIPNAGKVDPVFSVTEKKRHKLVWLGRMHDSVKNIDELFSVMKLLPEQYELHLYGDGLLHDHRVLVDNKQIFYHGSVDDLFPVFNDAGVSLCVSHHEGFPNILIESMSFGTPFVTYNNFCAARQFHKRGGLVVEKYNIKLLVESILEITSSRKKFEKYSNLALQESKNYCENIVMDKWISICQQD